jgi:DNA topoisomerase IB
MLAMSLHANAFLCFSLCLLATAGSPAAAAAAAAARYVWLGATSSFKAESDLLKYEKARKLKDYIDNIRKNYKRDWESSDVRKKQVRGTAVLLHAYTQPWQQRA